MLRPSLVRNLLAICCVLFFSESAYAVTMDFYTYKSHTVVLSALNMFKLILSDARFEMLFYAMMLGSVLITQAKQLGGMFLGTKPNFVKPMVQILIGQALFFGTVVPTGTLIVTDQVLNKVEAVDGIPEFAVLFLGAANLFERTFVEIADTSMIEPAMKYQNSSGGIGFSMLKEITTIKPDFKQGESFFQESLDQYIMDCVQFELTRPNTTISADTIKSTNDWMAILEASINPVVGTLVYTASVPNGTPMTCSEAWSGTGGLKNYLASPTPFTDIRKTICGKAGFDITDPLQETACSDIIESHVKLTTGGNPMPSSDYIRQAHMGKTFNNFLLKDPAFAAQAAASQKLMTSSMSTFMIADKYMPIIRGVLFGFAITLLPLVILLMATTVYGKAISLIFGFWTFLTLWGVIDCLLHNLAMTHALAYFVEIQASGTGFSSIMLTPSATGEALGVFGSIRMASVSIAALFSSIVGMNAGSVMAGFINQAMSPIRQAAAAGEQTMTVQGQGAMHQSIQSGQASVQHSSNTPYQQIVDAKTAQHNVSTASGYQQSQDQEASIHSAVTNEKVNQATDHETRKLAASRGESPETMLTNSNVHAQEQKVGQRDAEQGTERQLGVSSGEMARLQNGEAVSEKLANKHGGLLEGMHLKNIRQGDNGQAEADATGHLNSQEEVQAHRDQMKKINPNVTDDQLEKIKLGSTYNASINTATGEGDYTYATGVKAHETTAFSSTNSNKSTDDQSRIIRAGTSMDGNTAEKLAQQDSLAQHLYDKDGNYSETEARVQREALAAKLTQTSTATNTKGLSAQATAGLGVGGSSVSATTSASYQETLNGNMKKIQGIQDAAKEEAMKSGSFNKENHDAYYNSKFAELFPDADQKLREGGFEEPPKDTYVGSGPGAFSGVIKK